MPISYLKEGNCRWVSRIFFFHLKATALAFSPFLDIEANSAPSRKTTEAARTHSRKNRSQKCLAFGVFPICPCSNCSFRSCQGGDLQAVLLSPVKAKEGDKLSRTTACCFHVDSPHSLLSWSGTVLSPPAQMSLLSLMLCSVYRKLKWSSVPPFLSGCMERAKRR